MLWGSFTLVHIVTLLLAFGFNYILYFIIKRLPDKWQTLILFLVSLLGIGAIVYNLIVWKSPLEYLPFHLSSLSALILPFAIITKNKVINNLLLLWSLGALFALIVNTAQAQFEIFSWTFFFYYFPHIFECGIPIIMLLLKFYEKDYRCILSTILITFGVYTLAHLINLGINSYALKNQLVDWNGKLIQVNYMYSIKPENPLLAFFYRLIPYSYWYLFLALPIIALYLVVIYLPEILKKVKRNV